MCKLFIGADADLWSSSTKSLRIDGMVTSVRLENYFWLALTEIGHRDQLNIPQLLTKLYHESIDAGHDLGNFSSFLRVCCMRYLTLQLSGQIPIDPQVPLSTLPADEILHSEIKSLH
ncbi:MAG: ribbon-helix-helix domain-containing protein [Gammaproteobacteria bacterium]|nr:ribbon-helix-helix domain-containing protein [Gammaproteobacteria bacterium]